MLDYNSCTLYSCILEDSKKGSSIDLFLLFQQSSFRELVIVLSQKSFTSCLCDLSVWKIEPGESVSTGEQTNGKKKICNTLIFRLVLGILSKVAD